MTDIQKIIKELGRVFKAINVVDLGESVLSPEQSEAFIRVAQNASPLLADARRMPMNAPQRNIDRVGFGSRIMQASGVPTETKPTFATNKLDVKKSRGKVALSDDALEDNIERGTFETTLVTLAAERVGVDMEELFINGDTTSGDPYLALIDGWAKLAAIQLDGTANADFTQNDVESMFNAQLVALPEKFRRNRAMMRFYVPFNVENGYREVLKARGTQLGDQAQTGNAPLAYKGIRVQEVPNMADNTSLLAISANTVWGAYREVRIETDRDAENEETNYWISFRADCNYEDEDASVYASNADIPTA